MDKRFKTMPIIDCFDWEAMVMEEAGYGEYVDEEGLFDMPIFCRDKGFSYLSVCHFLNYAFCTEGENGSYKEITENSFIPKFYDRRFSQEVNEIRNEISKAAIRLFKKGKAPKEFVMEIYW